MHLKHEFSIILLRRESYVAIPLPSPPRCRHSAVCSGLLRLGRMDGPPAACSPWEHQGLSRPEQGPWLAKSMQFHVYAASSCVMDALTSVYICRYMSLIGPAVGRRSGQDEGQWSRSH
eukprot:579855-Pelagomonas_calceolata.AAC.1